MSSLDLKVPPDLVALVVAAAMWMVSKVTPSFAMPAAARELAAIVLIVAGVVFIFAARVSFAKARTTFSPIAPDHSSRLVTTGVYRLTRNPMYLGTLFLLLAFAARLSSPVAALVALSFVVYIDRFQITPEERVLRDRFGSAFDRYRQSVRRWI
ncbi:MAG: isoprenylcysteine carboxylmethyltransferase family protein [Gemmatimonadaceae bacterium]